MEMFPMTPQMNPTGAIGNGGITAPSTMVGGAGSYNFGNTMNPNPSQMSGIGGPGGGAPNPQPGSASNGGSTTPVMNPGTGTSGTGTTQQFVTAGQTGVTDPSSDEFGWQLDQTFGTGMGSVIEQFLQSGGGYNLPLTQQAVTAQEAAMQQAIQRGWGNIASNEAETGISPNSSTAALTQGDYYSNAVTQENAMISQEFYNMWGQSMQNETSILGQIMDPLATNKASRDSSWMTDLSAVFNMGTSALQTAGDLGWSPLG